MRHAGFTVYTPSMFGRDGAHPTVKESVATFTAACVSAEFRAFATNESTPVTQWLRSLARHAHEECGNPRTSAVATMIRSPGSALEIRGTEPTRNAISSSTSTTWNKLAGSPSTDRIAFRSSSDIGFVAFSQYCSQELPCPCRERGRSLCPRTTPCCPMMLHVTFCKTELAVRCVGNTRWRTYCSV